MTPQEIQRIYLTALQQQIAQKQAKAIEQLQLKKAA